jgi:hypothetical protein
MADGFSQMSIARIRTAAYRLPTEEPEGMVNPSLTIQAIACRPADRLKGLAARGSNNHGNSAR